MENYRLIVNDGIITDIETVSTNGILADRPESDGEETAACFYISKDIVGFSDDPVFQESFLFFDPAEIRVEEGNPVYEAKNNCLIRKKDRTMILGCRNSRIPGDGSVEHIGSCALCAPIVPEKIDFSNFTIPQGIKTIGYRAFANSSEDDIFVTVPDSVERVGSMAFMMTPGDGSDCTVTFYGSPELVPGVFGTKAESADSDNEVYRNMPDILYPKLDNLTVRGLKNSSVEEYCKKYGIRFEVMEEYYRDVITAIFGSNDIDIDFSDEFYNAFDELFSCLDPDERKAVKDVYLKRTLFRALRRLRNPGRLRKIRSFITADER